MICIACDKKVTQLAQSHVISNSFRKRLTGIVDSSGNKKFKFGWVDRPDLPRQDLPKPRLMCPKCDNELGAKIEMGAPSLLMPTNVDCVQEWEQLPIESEPLYGIFDTPLYVGVYNYPENESEVIDKFSLSVAWRSLHAMAKDGEQLSKNFLASARGETINNLTKKILFHDLGQSCAPRVSLYYLGPKSAAMTTNSHDEIPFAWTEIGDSGELLGVGVAFAYWVILWPLFECEPIEYFDKLTRLEQLCFREWRGHMMSELEKRGKLD